VIKIKVSCAVLGQEKLTSVALGSHPQVMLSGPQDGLIPIQDGGDLLAVDQEVEAAEIPVTDHLAHHLRPGSLDGPAQPLDVLGQLVAAGHNPRMIEPTLQLRNLRLIHRISRQVDATKLVDAFESPRRQTPVLVTRRPSSDEGKDRVWPVIPPGERFTCSCRDRRRYRQPCRVQLIQQIQSGRRLAAAPDLDKPCPVDDQTVTLESAWMRADSVYAQAVVARGFGARPAVAFTAILSRRSLLLSIGCNVRIPGEVGPTIGAPCYPGSVAAWNPSGHVSSPAHRRAR